VIDYERWLEPWHALGVRRSPRLETLYAQVVARYREPQRHYHTMDHLDECFVRWAELRSHATHPAEVELALWFHDAVYDTRRTDNEALSADLAREAMLGFGVAQDSARRVADLILFTRHAAEPIGPDAEALVDVDLSILGAAPARFDEYEGQVRREYSWVPEDIFCKRRTGILEQFLARDKLYSTALFRERYEPQARANLARSLAALR